MAVTREQILKALKRALLIQQAREAKTGKKTVRKI